MPTEQDPLEVAALALRHRDRSRQDVDSRLARAGVDGAARAEALAELERIGYVDDDRFARSRATSLADRGYGDAAIRADLEQQGLDDERITETIGSLASEAERAADVVARLGPTARTGAHLMRKGFAPEIVEELLVEHVLGGDLGVDDQQVV